MDDINRPLFLRNSAGIPTEYQVSSLSRPSQSKSHPNSQNPGMPPAVGHAREVYDAGLARADTRPFKYSSRFVYPLLPFFEPSAGSAGLRLRWRSRNSGMPSRS